MSADKCAGYGWFDASTTEVHHDSLSDSSIHNVTSVRNPRERSPLLKSVYATAGVLVLTIGMAGLIIPGLPGTPLILVAAWLFSMSSERLYTWTTSNPWFGQAVADYRAGLGIPRRTKIIAVTMVALVISYSIFVALDRLPLQLLVAGMGAYGVWFILTRPTREANDPEKA